MGPCVVAHGTGGLLVLRWRGANGRAVVNAVSGAVLAGYLVAAYVWPYIKGRWWNTADIRRRLRVRPTRRLAGLLLTRLHSWSARSC